MENENVFDQIAPSWYNYRHWTIFREELESLAQRWRKGKLLNIGCGHGADFLPFKDPPAPEATAVKGFELYGIDSSAEMLKLAVTYSQKYQFTVKLGHADACHLPYPDETFDWAISVATYHHLKTNFDRKTALLELKRVLKPGAEAFITVWNRWQPRFRFYQRETMVPWRTKEQTFYRYYYLFTYPELEKLVREAGLTILKSFPESSYRLPVKYFSRNICLVVRKD